LEFLQANLIAAASIAHPAKRLAKKSTHTTDIMIIKTVDHGLDHRQGLFSFTQVIVSR
jgi:hypothetical protein